MSTEPKLGRPITGPAPRINCPRCGKDCARRQDGTPQRHPRMLPAGRRSMLTCEETNV